MKKSKSKVLVSLMFKLQRMNHNLSQGEVARQINMYRENITQIEAGKRSLKIEEMLDFCELIGITPNEFLGYERTIK